MGVSPEVFANESVLKVNNPKRAIDCLMRAFIFAPALLIILPLNLYFSKIGLYDSYFALIWVYQLITLPLLLWIVRGYFEDISPDIEYAYRLDGHSWFQSFWRISIPLAKPGIAAASLLCFIYAWNNFVFATLCPFQSSFSLFFVFQ